VVHFDGDTPYLDMTAAELYAAFKTGPVVLNVPAVLGDGEGDPYPESTYSLVVARDNTEAQSEDYSAYAFYFGAIYGNEPLYFTLYAASGDAYPSLIPPDPGPV